MAVEFSIDSTAPLLLAGQFDLCRTWSEILDRFSHDVAHIIPPDSVKLFCFLACSLIVIKIKHMQQLHHTSRFLTIPIELRHEKTCFLHMLKQSRRSAARYRVADQHVCFCYIDSIITLLPES